MGLLGEIYSFGNRTRNRLKGLLDDPKGYIQQTADQTANTLRDMTGANETAQQFALRDKINAGDKNALAQYRNLEKTIQNKLFDVALNFNPAAVGMFIGKGAKTWDAAAAAEAEKRLSAGDDARKVWSELGVFRGPDGHLRQEIPDNNIPQKLRLDEKQLLSYPEMKDSLPHKQLYQAYPETANIRLAPVLGDELGHLDSSQNVIGLKPIGAGDFTPAASQQRSSTQIHELQHAIQQREGWAKGGSPEQMVDDYLKDKARIPELEFKITREQNRAGDAAKYADSNLKKEAEAWASKQGEWYQSAPQEEKIKDYLLQSDPLYNGWYKEHEDLKYGVGKLEPHDRYKRLAGEAEARATQARMNMDMAQRRATFPLDSYDVPVNQLIIRGGLLK